MQARILNIPLDRHQEILNLLSLPSQNSRKQGHAHSLDSAKHIMLQPQTQILCTLALGPGTQR